MHDMLRCGVKWLARKRIEHMAREMAYARSGMGGNLIPMTAGRTTRQVENGDGMFTAFATHDFIARVCDLRLFPPGGGSGCLVTPEAGDQIFEPVEDPTGEPAFTSECPIYEVMNLPGEGAWVYADDQRIEYRIHTKLVGRGKPPF